ncbi:MAG: hypothetical protein NVS4B8_10810 [Herpetosiphon sp.]
MSKASRYLACMAYLLSVPGALYVLIARRDDAFAVFHARQSLAIAAAMVAAPLIWAIIAWGCAWIPIAGPVIGLSLFALVIGAYLGLALSWVAGMRFSLYGEARLVPLVGSWTVPRIRAKSLPQLDESSSAAPLETTTFKR